MRTVVLVGTDHKFQKPVDGPHREGIEEFRNLIRQLYKRHKLQAIAEEMSVEVLSANCLHESVARSLCKETGGIAHNYSDPNMEERRMLGISDEIDTSSADRIREKEWLHRISQPDFNKWPLLFICGAVHFFPFAKLLRESGIHVIEAYQDWGPIIGVVSPAPLYTVETYPRAARAGRHLLDKFKKRIEIRNLLPKEKVTILESVCGKDFWAFYVKVDDGSEGWVLNLDKGINISYPTN